MMDVVFGILFESYELGLRMSPYLLFGFLFAGILHVFLSPDVIAKHLGKSSFGSVLKASVFGVPLPLCSCGVIPSALSLRREGASKGAVLSFLISTPTSGIDSIFATYALLGGFFAIYRVFVSFAAAFLVGIAANIFLEDNIEGEIKKKSGSECKVCSSGECEDSGCSGRHSFLQILKGIFDYAFNVLLKKSGLWVAVGILLGGVIAYFVPQELIESYLGKGLHSIVFMFVVGIPMYICSSGSVPVAGALMLKGLGPGAAFAFLFAGPATNTVTIAAVSKELGKGAAVLYVVSIALCSMVFGVLLDYLWDALDLGSVAAMVHGHGIVPFWLELSSLVVLILLLLRARFAADNSH